MNKQLVLQQIEETLNNLDNIQISNKLKAEVIFESLQSLFVTQVIVNPPYVKGNLNARN